MIRRAFLFTIVTVIIMFAVEHFLHTDKYLQDIGGISAFLVVYGALYGITAAFIVVEVWVKFNNTKQLIEKEAQGIEKFYNLTLYFRDSKLTKKVKALILDYITIIKHESFAQMGEGTKHTDEEKLFRKIAVTIRDIEFDDNHDNVLFGSLVEHYGELAQLRTERIHVCTVRLPEPLRVFFYASTVFTVLSFVFMPFVNIYYGLLVTGFLVFSLSMLISIVEGLDNPVKGYWKITPRAFEDAWEHIQGSYE
ncbi:MAG: hypothetical protein ACREGI_01895 [Candidatus Levyibacteriota bacterium]